MSIKRADIVREARALLGVPFAHQGLNPAIGIDCRGLLLCLARSFNIRLTQIYRTNYSTQPDSAEFRAALEAELGSIPIADLRDGDVAFIHWPREKGPTHTAVCATGPYEPMLIHALGDSRGNGKVIEDCKRRWERYITAAYRFPGVID